MTDWIIKQLDDNYAFVAIGRLIASNKIAVVINDEVRVFTISNPKPIKLYDCLIYGHIDKNLENIIIKDMMDIPNMFFEENFDIQFAYINPESPNTKMSFSKGNKLIGYTYPGIHISLKINAYYSYLQPLFILNDIEKHNIRASKGKKKDAAKKYICLATQVGL